MAFKTATDASPGFVTALQQQLGLKLEPTKALVVDTAEPGRDELSCPVSVRTLFIPLIAQIRAVSGPPELFSGGDA